MLFVNWNVAYFAHIQFVMEGAKGGFLFAIFNFLR